MTTPDSSGPVRFDDAGDPGGQTFGGYELTSELGRGGMGVVYKAVQHSLKRTVALKMLTGVVSQQELARFLAEAETAARLHHANIVHIYEVGERDKVPFFAMEFVEGGSLADKLKSGVMSPRDAAEMMSTVARAVHFAHEHGVVHRDLKPANVLLDTAGVPKIADFGIAKRLDSDATGPTVTGAVMGTPGYMAPEQAEGSSSKAGPWSDVYSLGAMLYELLTGRPPFVSHESETPIYLRVISEPAVSPAFHRPEIPRDLEAIVMMCLQKNKRDRFESAAKLADDLDRFLHDEPIKAKPPPLLRRSVRWIRRHPWLVGACLLASSAAGWGLRSLWNWEMYGRPRIEHSLSMDVRWGGIEPVGALDDDAAKHCGICLRLTRQGRRGPIVKAEVVNAKGRPATFRDVLEYDFLPSWLQGLAGAGTGTAKGRETISFEASHQDGDAIELVGRDRNGRVTVDVQYNRRTGTKGHVKSGLAVFRNEAAFDYRMPGGASHARFERDDAGFDVGFQFFNGSGTAARNGDGVFGYVLQRDASERLVMLRNVDAVGAPMANLLGVTQVQLERGARGQIVSGRLQDANGNPVASNGILGTNFTYDTAGNMTSAKRLLASVGAPASRGTASVDAPRWSVTGFEHDDAGQITRITYRNEGSGAMPPLLSRLDLAYDANGFPTECRSYGLDERESSRAQRIYDERGNVLEEKKWDGDGSFDSWVRRKLDPGGHPIVTEELDEQGRVEARTLGTYENDRLVRQTYEATNHESRPIGAGYTTMECRYHENGYRIEERYSGFRGTKGTLKLAYDELDRKLFEVWLDADEKPVPGPGGWVWRKLTYRGTTQAVLTDALEDGEGRVARGSDGYSRIRYGYDASGVLVSQAFEGFDQSHGFSSRHETLNARGVADRTEHFDAAGGKAYGPGGYHRLYTAKYDASGSPAEVVSEEYDPSRFSYFRTRALETWKGESLVRIATTYEDREGRPTPGPDGCSALERDLDDEGRVLAFTLSGCPVDVPGAVAWRTVNEWNADDTLKTRARQALDANGRPLAESGVDRPTRFEESLDASGNVTKSVKMGYSETVCGYTTIEAEFDAKGELKSLTHRRADGRPVSVHAIIVEVAPDAQKPAKDFRLGDILVSVNGAPIANSFDFVQRGAFAGGWIEVERDGKRIRIEGLEAGRIGIGFSDRAVR